MVTRHSQNRRDRGCPARGSADRPGWTDLARVTSAGLRDIALIHGLSTGHTPRFVLRKGYVSGLNLGPWTRTPRPACVPPRPPPPSRCPAPSPGPAYSRPSTSCPFLPHWRFLRAKPRPSKFAQAPSALWSAAGSLLVPPPPRPNSGSPLPCNGDSTARRCTWRRESGCISCSSSRPLGCTPERPVRRVGRRASLDPPT